jgi:hypothetical protein
MNKLLSCRHNMDTNRVEARFSDASAIAIDCIVIEDEYGNAPAQRAELDWLLYMDFCRVRPGGHSLFLFFQNCALIRAQRSSRFRVVAQQLFRTGPPLRQGDGYFVRCQVAQHQQLFSVRRTIAAVGQQVGIFREEELDFPLADDLVLFAQVHQRLVETAHRVRVVHLGGGVDGLIVIGGVPVVKPAFALTSHCIGVRPLSRLRWAMMSSVSASDLPSPRRML